MNQTATGNGAKTCTYSHSMWGCDHRPAPFPIHNTWLFMILWIVKIHATVAEQIVMTLYDQQICCQTTTKQQPEQEEEELLPPRRHTTHTHTLTRRSRVKLWTNLMNEWNEWNERTNQRSRQNGKQNKYIKYYALFAVGLCCLHVCVCVLNTRYVNKTTTISKWKGLEHNHIKATKIK